MLTRGYLRVRLEGRERLPAGPAIYCFNHLSAGPTRSSSWPSCRSGRGCASSARRRRTWRSGGRNRLMHWTGTTIPYKPGKNDLLEATRRVGAVIDAGGVVAIAGEGRIHAGESRAAAAQRGRRVLRAAVRRPARADRHQRDELAALRRAGPGPGRGADRRRAAGPTARGDRRADATGLPARSAALVADAPDVAGARAASGAG